LKGKVKYFIFFTALIIVFIFSTACTRGLSVIYEIGDFEGFLYRLFRQREENDDYEEERVSSVEGFEPLLDFSFDFARPFTGQFAYVEIEGEGFFVRNDGAIFAGDLALRYANIINDTIMFEAEGLYGIKSIFGSILIKPQYFLIEKRGNLMLASTRLGHKNVYRVSVEAANRLHEHLDASATFFDDGGLLYNGRLVCLDTLMPKTAHGYDIVSIAHSGMLTLLCRENFRFGFANVCGERFIEPQFLEAGVFNRQGFVYVVCESKEYIIICKDGKEVFREQDDFRPIHFDGEILTLLQYNRFFFADKNFELLSEQFFHAVYSLQVFNGKVIYNPSFDKHRIFSLEVDSFLFGEFLRIEVHDDFFIAVCEINGYTLFCGEWTILLYGYDLIALDGNILITGRDGRYYFCKRVTE